MKIRMLIALNTILCVASATFAGDWPNETPNPNPQFNPDGTMTWYIGFNTQYPFLQDAVDAASPGDELVIAPGMYVESITINTPDLTIRPVCSNYGDSTEWLPVTLWNPTEGFENENDFAVYFGSNTNNTYIGRPRQYTQLANGTTVLTQVPVNEWYGDAGEVDVVKVDTNFGRCTMNFWSRSEDNVSVYCEGAQATIQNCLMSGATGFGGCVLAIGSTANFVDCDLVETNAPGVDLNGYPVNVVTLIGGNCSFNGCKLLGNIGSFNGIVYQSGGSSFWRDCAFGTNNCISGFGTVTIVGGTASFADCEFVENISRIGTVYSDSTGSAETDFIEFTSCLMELNDTMDAQYGGAFFAVDAISGQSPRVHFDNCQIRDNNSHEGNNEFDIETPYFPEYRIGRDINSATPFDSDSPTGDFNGDGVVNGADLGLLLVHWTY